MYVHSYTKTHYQYKYKYTQKQYTDSMPGNFDMAMNKNFGKVWEAIILS